MAPAPERAAGPAGHGTGSKAEPMRVHKRKPLFRCSKGATAIEYAVLAALIATAAIAAFVRLGNEMNATFVRTNNAIETSTAAPSS